MKIHLGHQYLYSNGEDWFMFLLSRWFWITPAVFWVLCGSPTNPMPRPVSCNAERCNLMKVSGKNKFLLKRNSGNGVQKEDWDFTLFQRWITFHWCQTQQSWVKSISSIPDWLWSGWVNQICFMTISRYTLWTCCVVFYFEVLPDLFAKKVPRPLVTSLFESQDYSLKFLPTRSLQESNIT